MVKVRSDLVRLTTQDVSKAIPVTDTILVSEKLGIKQESILRMIRNYRKEFEEFGKLNGFEISSDSQRKKTAFELNEGQFLTLVAYSKNTEKARHWKRQFVKQFIFMKNELQARKETRYISVQIRKSLTDSIKNNVIDEGNFKKFAYSNYSKLAYKIVLGMKVKDFKEKLKLSPKDNVRDFLTVEQLEKVQEIESKIATRIEVLKELELSDKEIYKKIKEIL